MSELWLSGALIVGMVAGVLLEKLRERRRLNRQLFELFAMRNGGVRVTFRAGGSLVQSEIDAKQSRELLLGIAELLKG